MKFLKMAVLLAVVSAFWGCTANTKSYNLSAADAATLRDQTERMEQKDRDTRHVERMRRADAIKRSGVRSVYAPRTIIVPR